MTTERRTLTHDFDTAFQKYQAASEAWHTAAALLRDAQQGQRLWQQAVEDETARLRLDPRIKGKTIAERDADLTLLAKKDEGYISAQNELAAAKAETQKWQDEMTNQRDQMALQKRMMDWSIVRGQVHAQKGGESNGNRR